jgi:hypothetical protein
MTNSHFAASRFALFQDFRGNDGREHRDKKYEKCELGDTFDHQSHLSVVGPPHEWDFEMCLRVSPLGDEPSLNLLTGDSQGWVFPVTLDKKKAPERVRGGFFI